MVEAVDPLLIIPACEEVFHLAAQRRLADRLFAPPLAILRRLHSKSMFAADCIAAALPAPATSRVTSPADLQLFIADAANLVFKPEYSRFGTHALVAPTEDAVRKLAPSPVAPWVVQSRIHGAEVSFYAASTNSRLVAFSAYRSTWRFRGGAGYAFEPLDAALASRLQRIAETLAEKLIPRGQFACDVIVDEAGNPWLIECNPRATSGVHLFARAPDLALALLGRRDEPAVGNAASHHVAPAMWWYGLPEALQTMRMREWRAQRSIGRDVIGAPGDRAPAFGALVDTMAFGARALASKRGLAEITTADIEWNGEEL
jgi:ATP-grasp domain